LFRGRTWGSGPLGTLRGHDTEHTGIISIPNLGVIRTARQWPPRDAPRFRTRSLRSRLFPSFSHLVDIAFDLLCRIPGHLGWLGLRRCLGHRLVLRGGGDNIENTRVIPVSVFRIICPVRDGSRGDGATFFGHFIDIAFVFEIPWCVLYGMVVVRC
jgi:hypothetical protein